VGKSKYPNQIDTSVEIPAVRDNILQSGSDVINSIRSAIFSIEQVLGINPQGTSGNTVASRLNQALDENGNIKTDALSLINVLTGPILDNDVSISAAIKESKLRLDFPTKILQSQLSDLNLQIDEIISTLDVLNSNFLTHINQYAEGRHPSRAISISAYTSSGSDDSTQNISNGSVQSFAEELYDKHINFSGETSALNKSHSASQIFFDSVNSATITESNDVQGAIEDIANNQFNGIVSHQNKFHSDGILGHSKLWEKYFAEEQEVSFSKNSGSEKSTFTITLTTPISYSGSELSSFDMAYVYDPNSSFAQEYQISSLILSDDNLFIEGFEVFGFAHINSTPSTVCNIYKKTDAQYNNSSLLVCTRQDPNLTSSAILQVNDPRNAYIESDYVNPSLISASNKNISISIDGGTPHSIDVFDATSDWQTIDSVTFKINEYAAENFLNVSAYRFDGQLGSKIIISVNCVDSDSDRHYLTISQGSDDAIFALGFSAFDGIDIYSNYGTRYSISGTERLGIPEKLRTESLVYFAGSNLIQSGGTGIDFLELGVKKDDLLVITNSDDLGTYHITSVSPTNISVSSSQLPSGFSSSSDGTQIFSILGTTTSFRDIDFSEVDSSFGSILSEVFIDEGNVLNKQTVLEYEAQVYASKSVIRIVDYDGDISNQQFDVEVDTSSSWIKVSVDGSDFVDIFGQNSYVWITSATRNVSFKFFVRDSGIAYSKVIANGQPLDFTIYGFEPVNRVRNYLIARVPYDMFSGSFGGGTYGRPTDKRQIGTVSSLDIHSDVKEELSYRPTRELRANGLFYGCDIVSNLLVDDKYSYVMERGVAYVRGRRLSIPEREIVTEIDSTLYDKMYIAIDEFGNILSEPAIPGCEAPFSDSEVALIGTLEFDGTNVDYIDLRLFIDRIDLKLLNSITVSPEPGMAHFSDLRKALRYAKRFSSIYSAAGVPTVHLKSGTYDISVNMDASSFGTYSDWRDAYDANTSNALDHYFSAVLGTGIYIDFPVNIEGEGDSTVLNVSNNVNYGDIIQLEHGSILIPGDGFAFSGVNYDKVNSGKISIKNLKMKNCYIDLCDLNCQTSSVINKHVILIEGVTFESTTDSELGRNAVFVREWYDSINKKGNINIAGCSFVSGSNTEDSPVIYFSEGSRIYNSQLLYNTFSGKADSIFISGNGIDFFDSFVSSERNINILSTTNLSNFTNFNSVGAPEIYESQPITNRLSGGLTICGETKVGGDLHLQGDLIADSFNAIVSNGFSISAGDDFSADIDGDVFWGSDNSTHVIEDLFDLKSNGDISILAKDSVTIGQTSSPSFSPQNRIFMNEDGISIIANSGDDIKLNVASGGEIKRTNAVTRYLSLAGTSFIGHLLSSATVDNNQVRYITYTFPSTPATAESICPIVLPDNVTLSSLDIALDSDDIVGTFQVQLYEVTMNDVNTITQIINETGSLPATFNVLSWPITAYVTQNELYYYVLKLSLIKSSGTSSATVRVHHVKIGYSTTSVG